MNNPNLCASYASGGFWPPKIQFPIPTALIQFRYLTKKTLDPFLLTTQPSLTGERCSPLTVLGYLCPEFHEGANPKPGSRGGEGEATAAAQMSLPALNTELHELQTPFPTPPTELWMCLGGVREGRLKFFFHSAISHWEQPRHFLEAFSPLPLPQVFITPFTQQRTPQLPFYQSISPNQEEF